MTCRYAGPESPRLLPDGEACHKRHCIMPWCPGRHLAHGVPLTCPECIGDVRDELRKLRAYWLDLEGEALIAGYRGEHDEEVLGGDAMVMLGPYSDGGQQVRARYADLSPYTGKPRLPSLEMPKDPVPPLMVLAQWEDIWRDHRKQDAAGLADMWSTSDYLDRHLHEMAQVPEVPFEEFARDVRKLRASLEDRLRDGERPETADVQCGEAHCKGRLVRQADPRRVGYICGGDHRGIPGYCAWPRQEGCCDRGGLRDEWKCSDCGKAYPWNAYWYHLGKEYREKATALPAKDIRERLDVKPNTLRKWHERGKVKHRGVDSNGKRLYDLADVLRCLALTA